LCHIDDKNAPWEGVAVIHLNVNGQDRTVDATADTPLL